MSHFERLGYINSKSEPKNAQAIIVGLPYDGTSSYRSGSRFAPDEIRKASIGNLETFEPLLNVDLEDYVIADLGDLQIEFGQRPEDLLSDERLALSKIKSNAPILGLGGEHTVTLPLLERAFQNYPDLFLISFDAHTDLRENYAGSEFSHACVIKRATELFTPDDIVIFGARSGTSEEFEYAKQHNMIREFSEYELNHLADQIGKRPVYITFDLDGFDPKELPGTGTVEPGGFFWKDVEKAIRIFKKLNIVGADVVELIPSLDPTGKSTILAARLVRALLLLILGNQK